ncbi:hypothetical protein DIPPA_00942 [Diplonema papillatum]|nr:hypothetical protein DIPPA_00942 [Diplonema papillatum]
MEHRPAAAVKKALSKSSTSHADTDLVKHLLLKSVRSVSTFKRAAHRFVSAVHTVQRLVRRLIRAKAECLQAAFNRTRCDASDAAFPRSDQMTALSLLYAARRSAWRRAWRKWDADLSYEQTRLRWQISARLPADPPLPPPPASNKQRDSPFSPQLAGNKQQDPPFSPQSAGNRQRDPAQPLEAGIGRSESGCGGFASSETQAWRDTRYDLLPTMQIAVAEVKSRKPKFSFNPTAAEVSAQWDDIQLQATISHLRRVLRQLCVAPVPPQSLCALARAHRAAAAARSPPAVNSAAPALPKTPPPVPFACAALFASWQPGSARGRRQRAGGGALPDAGTGRKKACAVLMTVSAAARGRRRQRGAGAAGASALCTRSASGGRSERVVGISPSPGPGTPASAESGGSARSGSFALQPPARQWGAGASETSALCTRSRLGERSERVVVISPTPDPDTPVSASSAGFARSESFALQPPARQWGAGASETSALCTRSPPGERSERVVGISPSPDPGTPASASSGGSTRSGPFAPQPPAARQWGAGASKTAADRGRSPIGGEHGVSPRPEQTIPASASSAAPCGPESFASHGQSGAGASETSALCTMSPSTDASASSAASSASDFFAPQPPSARQWGVGASETAAVGCSPSDEHSEQAGTSTRPEQQTPAFASNAAPLGSESFALHGAGASEPGAPGCSPPGERSERAGIPTRPERGVLPARAPSGRRRPSVSFSAETVAADNARRASAVGSGAGDLASFTAFQPDGDEADDDASTVSEAPSFRRASRRSSLWADGSTPRPSLRPEEAAHRVFGVANILHAAESLRKGSIGECRGIPLPGSFTAAAGAGQPPPDAPPLTKRQAALEAILAQSVGPRDPSARPRMAYTRGAKQAARFAAKKNERRPARRAEAEAAARRQQDDAAGGGLSRAERLAKAEESEEGGFGGERMTAFEFMNLVGAMVADAQKCIRVGRAHRTKGFA